MPLKTQAPSSCSIVLSRYVIFSPLMVTEWLQNLHAFTLYSRHGEYGMARTLPCKALSVLLEEWYSSQGIGLFFYWLRLGIRIFFMWEHWTIISRFFSKKQMGVRDGWWVCTLQVCHKRPPLVLHQFVPFIVFSTHCSLNIIINSYQTKFISFVLRQGHASL